VTTANTKEYFGICFAVTSLLFFPEVEDPDKYTAEALVAAWQVMQLQQTSRHSCGAQQ
jgi:hypothetical protein